MKYSADNDFNFAAIFSIFFYNLIHDFVSNLCFLLLSSFQNIDDIRNVRRTKVPIFDLESGARSGFKDLEVSEDCGVVSH